MWQGFALDAPLAYCRQEFIARLHLWRAVYAHRARDAALVPAAVAHAEEACKVLRAMIPVAPASFVGPRTSLILARTTKAQSIAQAAPKRIIRSAGKTVAKTKTAGTKAKVPPVTPRKRKGRI